MSDKPDEGVNDQNTEYDGTDPEVPLVIHETPARSNERDPEKRHNASNNYVRPALHWLRMANLWLWEKLIKKGPLWTVVSTVVIAVATTMYTCYARRQWKAVSDEIPELRKAAGAAKDANEIFAKGQRPWVGISGDVKLQSPLRSDPNPTNSSGFHFDALVTFKNFRAIPSPLRISRRNHYEGRFRDQKRG